MSTDLAARVERAKADVPRSVLRMVNAGLRAMDCESSRLELTILGAGWLLGRLCHQFGLSVEQCASIARDGYKYSVESNDGRVEQGDSRPS
jgi:hypothetical protein